MRSEFLIAAPSSNCGKTTVTLGILRSLANAGLKVQPFKCGPDYIDPKHHSKASGKTSINLDTFMMSKDHVKEIYQKYGAEADVLLTEGVMGLFDGATRSEGSSAEIAALLDIPVILVVNARAMAYSAAPLIFGFSKFDPKVRIAGVIFNYVNTESHYQFLKEACEDTGIEALGYLPVNEEINIPSRHLGLTISTDHDFETCINKTAAHLEKTVNISRLLEICKKETPAVKAEKPVSYKQNTKIIAVAKDEAFNFIYQENLEALKQLGEVQYFSPLTDTSLPDADLIYLAGGYPELHLDQLAANEPMRITIANYCKKGGRVFAECGGMMYLGKQIIDKDGKKYPMVNFLDIETSMAASKLTLGYRKAIWKGKEYRGHEFHYSGLTELSEMENIGKVFTARDKEASVKIYKKEGVIASYIHFYMGETAIFFAF